MKMMQRLWNDEAGFVISAELVLIVTIAILGMVVGLAAVRDGVTSELGDIAEAINALNQGYTYDGLLGHSASVAGSIWQDGTDFCDRGTSIDGAGDEACITHPDAQPNEPAPTAPPAVPN